MQPPGIVIDPEPLQSLVAAIIGATGSGAEEAVAVAGNLLEANLCGHDSHGVGLAPAYAAFARGGGIVPNQSVRIAGEPEREMRARRVDGIPIDGNTWAGLLAAARDAGVPAHEIARHAGAARPAPT